MNRLIYFSLSAISLSIISCSHATQDNSHAHETEHKEHQTTEITLHPEEAERFGIETSIVKTGDFNATIKVSGKIYPSTESQQTISATKPGIVHFSKRLNVGSLVYNGMPVVSISADKIVGGDDEKKAKITLENAKQEYERISALYNEKIVTEQDYLTAKESYLQALNAYKPQAENVTSNFQGTITAIYVNEGDYVTTGTPIATVSSSKSLILQADMPERYRNMVVKTANFKTTYSDSTISISSLGGKLLSQPNTAIAGYVPISFIFDNDGSIMANSYAEVFLIGEQQHNVVTLPIEALTEEQGEYFVYEKVDAECYMKHLVETGLSDGINIEIKSGITPGMEIVTNGATIIKLASNAGAVPGHSHEH